MKTTSSYFPFLVISLVLYACFFAYIDQPKSITALPLNSGEQSIQVQLFSQPKPLDKQLLPPVQEKAVVSQPEVASRPEVVKDVKTQTKKVIKYSATGVIISESEVKLSKQTLQEKIAETSTDHAQNLKAEVFHPQQATDKRIINETEQPSNTKKQPSAQTSSSAAKKAVVKKLPQENSASLTGSTKNQGVLQEAIVVSGRKPVYPQRAILRNQQGRVVVKLTVTKKGQPQNPKILTSSGFSLLDNAVLAFIHQELFMPALQGEDKVISEQLFAFRFELN